MFMLSKNQHYSICWKISTYGQQNLWIETVITCLDFRHKICVWSERTALFVKQDMFGKRKCPLVKNSKGLHIYNDVSNWWFNKSDASKSFLLSLKAKSATIFQDTTHFYGLQLIVLPWLITCDILKSIRI